MSPDVQKEIKKVVQKSKNELTSNFFKYATIAVTFAVLFDLKPSTIVKTVIDTPKSSAGDTVTVIYNEYKNTYNYYKEAAK